MLGLGTVVDLLFCAIRAAVIICRAIYFGGIFFRHKLYAY